ncbi:MAG: tRNA (guanosine(37)-N1)-methyltransferase TrmD [Planctomycetota bacterium]
MRVDIVSLFPEMYGPVLATSMPGRAAEKGAAEYAITDLREFGVGPHNKVDDRPFGGGPGMVMTAPVLSAAVEHATSLDPRPPRRVLLTPIGRPLTHTICTEYANLDRLMLIATHYEGYDERFTEKYQPDEISLGDFVLSGGELAAMVLLDAVVRLLPGVLGDEASNVEDSFADGSDGLLDHPHYTRPPTWEGMAVPDVLRSGDHAKIDAWRKQQRLSRTRTRRPDLLAD